MTRSERTEENEALIAPSPFDSSAELGVRDKALKFRDGAVIVRGTHDPVVNGSLCTKFPRRCDDVSYTKAAVQQFEVINS